MPADKAAGLVIRRADSHALDGDRRRPITAPQGFRWRSAPEGTLAPDYDG